jgi:predicted phosphodiesterase
MRVLVLSDVHANKEALDSVLLETKGDRDTIWCLGDVVGYGPNPDYCVSRLREESALVVAGNHDAGAVGGIDIGFFSSTAAERLQWTQRHISEETHSWLSSLPKQHLEMGYTLLHGSPTGPVWDYVLDGRSAAAAFSAMETVGGFNGHTHLSALFSISWRGVTACRPRPGKMIKPKGRKWLANPGSCGVPRDGDNRASYLLFDTATGKMVYYRLEYPYKKTLTALRSSGAPRALVELIRFGG